MHQRYSWKSYIFLILSILIPVFLLLIDPISQAISEQFAVIMMLIIFLGAITSIILAILVFLDKKERKGIAYIALALTLINISIIGFFLLLGANFAP